MTAVHLIFCWVLMSSVRASLLTLVVLAAQWTLRHKLPSRWRYALWLPVLVALVLPAVPVLPAWMNWTPAFASSQAQASDKTAVLPVDVTHALQTPPSEAITAVDPMASRSNVQARAFSAAQIAHAPASHVANALGLRVWGIVAWLIGTAVASCIVIVSFALTMRRIRQGARSSDAKLLAMVDEIARGIGLARTPRVLQSSAVASPAVCGVWRPTLLLNERFPSNISPEEADLVLRHELFHIRRGDLALNTLLCSLLALHWFNPLLWLAFSRVRADREAACDAQVLEGGPQPVASLTAIRC